MVDEKKIRVLLKEHFTYSGKVTVDSQGQITVTGDVKLKKAHIIPPEIQFLRVDGDFELLNKAITTLRGSPQSVGKNFSCLLSQITSLEHAPKTVDGNFYCTWTPITSLLHAPQRVGGNFDCSGTKITSLEHAPKKVGGSFECSHTQITSLEGAPARVNGDFSCQGTQITSLQGAPQIVNGNFSCESTKISSLNGLPSTITGQLSFTWSRKLPLLKALVAQKGVKFYGPKGNRQTGDALVVEQIINRYAGQGKIAIFDCQKDLEDAGFEGNARW